MSILYLVKKRAEDRGTVRGYLGWLPTSRRIDELAYRFLAFAFPLWTFTVAAVPSGRSTPGVATGAGIPRRPGRCHLGDLRLLPARALDRRMAGAAGRGHRDHRGGVVLVQLHRINLLVSGLHSYAGI
jgi:hypothetical protein